MNQKRLLIGVLFGLLVTVLWWFFHKEPKGSLAAQQLQPPTPAAQSTPIEEKPKADVPQEAGKQLPGGPWVASDPRWKRVEYLEKTDKNWEWKTPIEFYGKVIDERDQPVSDAKIHFVWNDTSAAGSSEADTISDGAGLFSLTGVRGKILGVKLEKSGYYTSQKQNRFDFEYAAFWDANYYQPDSKNPVIFRLLKKGQAEPLIVKEIRMPLPRNGTIGGVNLLNGSISSSGQFRVQAWSMQINRQDRFDWRVVMTVPEGGLQEFTEEFAFTAPLEGYQPITEINMPLSLGDNWKRSVGKNYYIAFGQPRKYGKLHIEVKGDGENVFINYWLNPSGSQNLEYDPSKQAPAQ